MDRDTRVSKTGIYYEAKVRGEIHNKKYLRFTVNVFVIKKQF